MKYCARCGAELHDEAVICTKCGCNVEGVNHYGSTSNSYNVLAIVGFALSFFSTIVGLILSIIGYKQAKQNGEKGKEFAIAGIVISSVSIVIAIIVFIIYFGIIFAAIGAAGAY